MNDHQCHHHQRRHVIFGHRCSIIDPRSGEQKTDTLQIPTAPNKVISDAELRRFLLVGLSFSAALHFPFHFSSLPFTELYRGQCGTNGVGRSLSWQRLLFFFSHFYDSPMSFTCLGATEPALEHLFFRYLWPIK